MKAIKYPECNHTYAADQDEYHTLHVWHSKDIYGEVISGWGLTWKERFKIFFGGKIFLSVLTFRSPLQPQRMATSFEDAKINFGGQADG